MKKTNILLTLILSGIFALAGCGGAETANTAKNTNGASLEKKEETAKVLKPADVSPDKAVGVNELSDGIFADKEAWKDKDVAVKGYIGSTSGSGGGKGFAVTLRNDKDDQSQKSIGCMVPTGDTPKDMLSKTIEVKGKIQTNTISDSGGWKSVRLDPCEVISQ